MRATVWLPMADDAPAVASRRRPGGIRMRTTAAAVLVVGLGLVLGAVAMVVLLQRSLRGDVRTSALARGALVADALSSGSIASVIASGDPEEEFVQVLDATGNVVTSSVNVSGRSPLASPVPGETDIVHRVPFEDGPFLAVATSAHPSGGPVTVVVGRSLEDVDDAAQAVTRSLAVGIPILLVLVGAVTWAVTGRALAPVEEIRSEVEAISTEELHRRVPDPRGSDEIARLAETMNRMLARLEAGDRRQRRLVSDASHELRSPVATIRQYAEIALQHPDETSLRELAEVVLDEDVRLQRLVDDLLLLTRIDEARVQLQVEPLDLDDLVFEEASRLRTSTDLDIDVRRVSAGRIRGDRDRLARLLRNLTDNASRHARSAVILSLTERDDEVILAVEDDGSGVARADRERIFDRFVRLEEARDRDSGGSGLGLSIAQEIAELHGGAVGVADSDGGGARFEVRFPTLSE